MRTERIAVDGLDCMDCAHVLETVIAKEPGVTSVRLDFYQGILEVCGDFDTETIHQRIVSLGYKVKQANQPTAKTPPVRGIKSLWLFLQNRQELHLVGIGLVLFFLSFALEALSLSKTSVLIVQLLALGVAGFSVFKSAFKGLFISRSININLLMSMAALGAVLIGEATEALVLLILFALSETLEEYTNDKARQVLSAFSELAPQSATLITSNGYEQVAIDNLNIGDKILVRSGERFSMDGIVRDGESAVNQAPITGESTPVLKQVGDEVFSGTVNGQGVLTVEVTRRAEDNTIQRIIQLVTQAQASKAKTQKFIDRFAKYYTPMMMVLALLVAIIPTVFFNQPLLNNGAERGWLYRSLSLLVIGCPCALVISTPVTIISALTRAARSGIIFKGGVFLERLSKLKVIAFDKTGTLTRGQAKVTQVRALECTGETNCTDCDDLLALACSLEQNASHPLREAILTEGALRGVADRYAPALNLQTLGGKGLMGRVDSRLATIGSLSLFRSEHKTPDQLMQWVEEAQVQGQTTMLICDGNKVRGFISVSDAIREETPEVIQQLKQLRIQPVMLTGDNQGVAHTVGMLLGIDEIKAELLPENKVSAIQELRKLHGEVAMIGDGINDSPALAIADVGIAMGGSKIAQVLETADVVLMTDDLHKLPLAIKISAFANRLILQNILFSLLVKFFAAALALLGWVPLWAAVIADMGVSLLVTFNGMRALRYKEHGAQNLI